MLTGGKFANGAVSAAAGWAAGQIANRIQAGIEDWQDSVTSKYGKAGGQNTDADIKTGQRMDKLDGGVMASSNVAEADRRIREWYSQHLDMVPEELDDFLNVGYESSFPSSGTGAQQFMRGERSGETVLLGGSGINVEKAAATIFHEYGHHTIEALNAANGNRLQTQGSENAAVNYSRDMCRRSGLC